MKITRERRWKSGKLHSFIRLELTEEERNRMIRARLMDVKIQMSDGSLIGKTLSIPTMTKAFEANVRKVRDRWSVAIVRTSGSVFLDLVILYVKLVLLIFKLAFRAIFGTRKTVKSLIRGIRFSSKRVEEVKETETFIFISVAAIFRAMDLAGEAGSAETLDKDDVLRELAGLSFSATSGAASSGRYSKMMGSGLEYHGDEGHDGEDDEDDLDDDEADLDTDLEF